MYVKFAKIFQLPEIPTKRMKEASIATIRRNISSILLTALVAIISLPSLAQDIELNENGQKLFKSNCTSCHSIGKGKLIGPDLAGVNERRDEEWLISWIRNSQEMIKAGDPEAVAIYEEYNKTLMTAFPQFSDEDIKDVLAYIDYAEKAAPAKGPVATSGEAVVMEEESKSPFFYLSLLVGLILLLNLFVRIKNNLKEAQGLPTPTLIKSGKEWLLANKGVIVLLILFAVIGGLKDTWDVLTTTGVHQDYQPEQPIQFSHKIHAGDNAIDCNYCHSSARHSKTSGIPSANVCMNCHKYITEGTMTGKEEIAKIYEAVGFNPDSREYIEGYEKKPIKWVRIHNLPDLAYFNHSQHVTAAGLECQQCHGPVETMEEVYQYSPLTMGWCIDCHRTNTIDTDNPYYEGSYQELVAKHEKKDINPRDIGALECGKCHY